MSVRLGQGIEDVQDILVADETGFLRANKVNIRGIGRTSTVGVGWKEEEAKNLLAIAISISMRTFAQGRKTTMCGWFTHSLASSLCSVYWGSILAHTIMFVSMPEANHKTCEWQSHTLLRRTSSIWPGGRNDQLVPVY
jgi:hypothetical protein